MVFAARYYRRAYVDALLTLVDLLRRPARYAEIMEVCVRALSIEDFLDTEQIHYYYMEALAKQGRTDDPMNHDERVARRLHFGVCKRALGVDAGPAQGNQGPQGQDQADAVELQVGLIRQLLVGTHEMEGAYLCDRDVFRERLRLNHRQRGERQSGIWSSACSPTPLRMDRFRRGPFHQSDDWIGEGIDLEPEDGGYRLAVE